MKKIPTQVTLTEYDEEYAAFVEKFKPKKTTDDCYTPPNIFEAVAGWVCDEYGIRPEQIVRPFWPGGDYERFPYTDDSVVIDNPPFSILAEIVRFYCENGVRFFLFAPSLTLFTAVECDVTYIAAGCSITYENGAVVSTGFITNMDREYRFRTAPELWKRVKEADDENRSAITEGPHL